MSKNKNEEVYKIGINWYPGHMAKTKRLIRENLNFIDIVYELVDARMPKSSKIVDIDEIIKDKPKIMIMTKIDLCDLEETKKWIKYYENQSYHVLPLNLEDNKSLKPLINLTNEVLKDYHQKREDKGLLKRKSRALIIGIPNVGKSTLINRLSGKKVVQAGNKPGVTKQLNWIRVNEDLELLDTPGILWPKLAEGAYNLASLTAIKEEVLPLFDVAKYILETLSKYYPKILKERYNLEKLDDVIINDLEYIGRRRGCLIKGGEVDIDKVIILIINDVKLGNIKGITFDRF
ncbi:MAG TPA: ribosome biogenesis GTPase YlqF [Candidatus Coprosoma intestinipullorum]|uniref:Ribosome biogenesis GTPase A n=1 Tax=Candidatus Coprosoma intestinipullorum TaxID=2840752 RepID=A0A9D0ZPW0_9FIRM|nr:ribosome biogenesis GTPase YlqF [Candidatus Coprosoma intestinipullorum]